MQFDGFLGGLALMLAGFCTNQLAAKYGYRWGRISGSGALAIGYALLFLSSTIAPIWTWGSGSMARMAAVVATSFLVTGALGAGAAYVWMRDAANDPKPTIAPSQTAKEPSIPTLRDLFREDFPGFLRSTRGKFIETDGGRIKVEVTEQLYLDFMSKSKFVAFFIPRTPVAFDLCFFFADNIQGPFEMEKSIVRGGMLREQIDTKDLVFTGRVYIYLEDEFSIEHQAAVVLKYREKGLTVSLRGPEYLAMQIIMKKASSK